MIYHITSAAEARQAATRGEYLPQAFTADGFIHCSHPHQVCRVANARFTGQRDLVLIEIDPARAGCNIIDENLEGGSELFPHVYGPLPMSAVVRILDFPCDDTGRFDLPI